APARPNAAEIVPQQSGASGPGGASNRTVVIQWPNSNGAPPSTNQPAAPSSNRHQPRPAARIELSSFNGRTADNRRLRETEAMRIAANSVATRKSWLGIPGPT